MTGSVPRGGSTVPRRTPFLAVLALLLAASSGCSTQTRFEVQSDTCWDGFVDRQGRLAECGDKSYRVVGTIQCVQVQKQTQNGYLRVRIEGRSWVETTEPFGSVSVCR